MDGLCLFTFESRSFVFLIKENKRRIGVSLMEVKWKVLFHFCFVLLKNDTKSIKLTNGNVETTLEFKSSHVKVHIREVLKLN